MSVPANATPLPVVHRTYGFLTADLRIYLPGLMRRALGRARHECKASKGRTTWRAAMSMALRETWAEAKSLRDNLRYRALPPASMSALERAQLELMSIQCAERPSRPELRRLSELQNDIAAMHAMSRSTVEHFI